MRDIGSKLGGSFTMGHIVLLDLPNNLAASTEATTVVVTASISVYMHQLLRIEIMFTSFSSSISHTIQVTKGIRQRSTGLYVGIVSPVVLDNLWARIDGTITVGSFTLVHSCHELEQGFNIRMTGPQSRPLFDMDGLLLTSRVPQDDEPELDEEDTEDAA